MGRLDGGLGVEHRAHRSARRDRRRPAARPATRWSIVLAAGLFAAGGCAGGGIEHGAEARAETDSARTVDGASSRGEAALAASGAAAPTGSVRDLVVTAELTVVARNVGAATARAEELVAERGGYVFGQEGVAGGDASATLVLKVPPGEYRGLLTDLSGLGDEERRSVLTDDVTAEGVDLDARIASAQRSVDRVRSFLDEAKNVGELAGVESELTRRETELEQLQGQRRVLDDQVALATITLTLNATPAPPPPATDALAAVPGFGKALAGGAAALVKVGRVVAAGLGYALPFLVVAAIPLLVRRRLRGRHPRPTSRSDLAASGGD